MTSNDADGASEAHIATSPFLGEVETRCSLITLPLCILRNDPVLGPMPAQIEACRYFVSGCTRGDDCAFSHLLAETLEDIEKELMRLKLIKSCRPM